MLTAVATHGGDYLPPYHGRFQVTILGEELAGGRKLGRNPNHQRALLRALATALFLTERDATDDANKPKVKGRIITTIEKAKEVRPFVERCITIARVALPHQEKADHLEPNADRNSEQWRAGAPARGGKSGIRPSRRW